MTIHAPPSIQSLKKLPTLREWKALSVVGSPFGAPYRRDDPALVKIDNLVEALNHAKDVATRTYLLCVLWFTTGYWHNHFSRPNSRMESARKPAITSLLLFAQNELGTALGCGVGGLAAKLTQIYGKTMDTHGHICDFGEKGKDYYLAEAERDKFRIVFMNRLAYRFEFTERGWSARPLVLLDTKYHYYGMDKDDMSEEEKGWAYFVMSMSSEIYMGPHFAGGQGIYPKFHSSYMGGKAIQCGGTMRITNGVVTGVKNDSGHYKPVDESLAKVLELLNTVGMDLSKIEVRTVEVKVEDKVKGDAFLRENGNWDGIRRKNCAQMYSDFSSGKKNLHQLVDEYYKRECAANKVVPPYNPVKMEWWKGAYRAVCWDLALFDAKWKALADAHAISPTAGAPLPPRTPHPSIGVKKV
jgi:hypothetical protein